MAISFAKKPATPKPDTTVTVKVPHVADADTLAAIGLGPLTDTDPPKPKGIVIKKASQFSVGDRVVVTNGLYHWVKHYQKGDVGTIVKVSGVSRDIGGPMPSVTLYTVLLDHPRAPETPTVVLAAWEIEALK